jgi:hypothetical protein
MFVSAFYSSSIDSTFNGQYCSTKLRDPHSTLEEWRVDGRFCSCLKRLKASGRKVLHASAPHFSEAAN